MFRKLLKKRVAVLGAVALLASAGAAYAYFTGGSNSATGSGSVGASTGWGVTLGTNSWSGSLAALYPGATNDTEYIPFTVTNNGHGHQQITSIAASLPAETSNGDAETSTGGDISGCQASWFTAAPDSSDASLPANLAPGATYTGKIDLTMQDSGTNQNSCQNAAPAVTITAN